MKFEQQTPDALLVEGYAGRGFVAGGHVWPDGLLISATSATVFAALDLAAFVPLATLDPPVELVLIGTGASMTRPPRELLSALAAQGYATDFMDSRAAARTYNVLVSEGRQVAAALLPVG